MKTFRLLFSLIGLLVFNPSFSQNPEITIQVTNPTKEPIALATIKLVLNSDSSRGHTRTTDATGKAVFTLTANKVYRATISSVGFTTKTEMLQIGDQNLQFAFSLLPAVKSLSGVVVTATKPLVRQEDDKTIIDPEPLAAASTNAYEIIEKTPGIFADQDGNIFLTSTTPATIFINGREQRMSAADIAAMLKSLPPGSIASIEVLRTPSARYDASGGGGIVNIVLKKGVRIGLTGSVNVAMNQGKYGNQVAGFNLNNSNGRFGSFINVQISRRNNYERLQTDRLFGSDTLLGQNAFTTYPAKSFFSNFGINYSPNKKWDLAYDGRISLNGSDNSSSNRSVIQKIGAAIPVSENIAGVSTHNKSVSLVQGLSAKLKWDSLGSEWASDFSYSIFPSSLSQDYETRYLVPQRNALPGTGTQERGVHQLQAQTNVLYNIRGRVKLEGGFKTTNVWFDNQSTYYFVNGNQKIPDRVRTNQFRYTENIHAAFLQAARSFSGIVVKAGARLENTRMYGVQKIPYDTAFRLNRTDLFPYVYLSRNLTRIAGYDLKAYLVYRRTISRPAYEYLNPAPRYIDPYLFEMGNPSLRPQFNTNYEANVSVDERPILAIGWNDTKDIFSQVVYQADSSSAVTYRTYDNLGANREFYFRALGAIPPGKRYFFVLGVQYNQNKYNGLYESKPFRFDRGSWTVFTYQTFRINALTQLSLNGFARFKGQLQFYELSSFGALNINLNRQLLNKKLTVGLNLTDILYTNNNRFSLRQGSVNATGLRQGDTRRFGINLRYNFGLRKKEDQNFMNIESPEKAGQVN